MNQDLLREYLLEKFLTARYSNSSYSKRAFAKRIGVSHGSLIEIMNGKRKVSKKMAMKLCEKICLNPKQVQLILDENSNVSNPQGVELREDQFELISNWSHFAVLNLIKLKNEIHSLENFASRLSLPVKHVEKIMERLLRLKLIEKSSNRYIRTKHNIKTTDDVRSISIKMSHKSMLEFAAKQVDDVPVEFRDMTSIILPTNTKKLNAAKKLIRQFHDKMETLLEDDVSTEVYSLNIQLIEYRSLKVLNLNNS